MEAETLDRERLASDTPHSADAELAQEKPPAEDAPKDEPLPDSARGWLVVLGAFLLQMVAVGSINSFGVYMQEYKLTVFPTTPASTLAWIGSLQFSTMFLFDIGAGVLLERIDPRAVVVLGSVVSGGALMAASACKTPTGLLLTQGLLFGIGASCLTLPTLSLPAQWMVRYRALATG
ncbi:hypothetical protein IWQ56_002204, partial [Coemansia nantahalensis]